MTAQRRAGRPDRAARALSVSGARRRDGRGAHLPRSAVAQRQGAADGTGEWTPAAGLALSGQRARQRRGVSRRTSCAWWISAAMARCRSSARGVDATGLRLSGFYARGARREAVQGQVGSFALRGQGHRYRRRGAELVERIFPRRGATAPTGSLLRDRRIERRGYTPRRSRCTSTAGRCRGTHWCSAA